MRFLYHIIFAGIGLAGIGLSSCAPIMSYHGNDAPDDKIAKLRPHVSTHQDVSAAIGSPNTVSLEGNKLWLYISRETKAWLPTFETEANRRIIAVSFGKDGKVKNIRKITEKNGRVIAFVPEITPAPIPEVNWIQRLFNNIGRVSPIGLPEGDAP